VQWRGQHPIPTLGGAQKLWCLSEQGLYFFLGRSDKEKALPLQMWTSGIVLPAIRKDGGYVHGEEKVSTGELGEADLLLKAFTMLNNKVERLQKENAEMHHELHYLSVSEFVALSHEYASHRDKVNLGKEATRLCKEEGIEYTKQERELKIKGEMRKVYVHVYPKEVLLRAKENLA